CGLLGDHEILGPFLQRDGKIESALDRAESLRRGPQHARDQEGGDLVQKIVEEPHHEPMAREERAGGSSRGGVSAIASAASRLASPDKCSSSCRSLGASRSGWISPPATRETFPVSSETTTTTASVSSVMPNA